MVNDTAQVPVVMAFSGIDATGGAGIQADIESLASMGCHAAPIVTALTVQDTRNVQSYVAVDASQLIAQARAVLEDIPVRAFKIGMLGSVANAEAIHSILADYPNMPVVVDPVLVAGGGGPLSSADETAALINLILPLTTVLTPNTAEAMALAPEADTIDAAAQRILDQGPEFVLVTGTDQATRQVENRLFGNRRLLETYTWDRLHASFHGSGCTLASAIAGLLAQGMEPYTALFEAQEYTWETLKHGYRLGMGQLLPNRLFWSSCGERVRETIARNDRP